MKKIFFINIFFIVLAHQFVSAHTREMMMQIVNSTGEPIYKSVQLYIDRGLFYELYRTGYSTDYWKWTQPNANVACDVSDSNTVQPTWASIEPGTYILRCENKYAILTVNYLSEDTLILLRNSGGDGDFNIRYENEVFSLVFPRLSRTIS